MLQLHSCLCWRLFWRRLTSCIFLLSSSTSFSWLMWREQLEMTHCQVIKHMEKEPPLSLHVCPHKARAFGGDLQNWPSSRNCTESQTLPIFPNLVESLSLWVPYSHPNQGGLIPHADPFGLLCLSPDKWPCSHPRRDHGGFLCVQPPRVQGPDTIGFISCAFARFCTLLM